MSICWKRFVCLVVFHLTVNIWFLTWLFVLFLCRPLTIPSITLPPSATDAFSAAKFTTKFDGDDAVDSAPKNDLLEEEEKYLEAFKVRKVFTLIRNALCHRGCVSQCKTVSVAQLFNTGLRMSNYSACSGNRSAIFARERSFNYAWAEYYL